ncbi:CPBP family intramembrane glutamic endopeptidase [Halomarina oriensis]|uniref:CPBP family intramembrane metalloprotease n=1 Tax=Halomarina oriensis TaxID=671145 RepID=A0A6B0GTA5_9EURY|nr:type II CAAX endopeptidase family protein [Halomarina oriensis]MWG35365.1 CPBP family intramembrane metalloprotease [Halomarina oriensis]
MTTTRSKVTGIRTLLVSAGLAIGGLVAGTVLVSVAILGLEWAGVSVFDHPARQLFLSTVLLQGVAFGSIALGYLALSDRELSFLRVRVPTLRDLGWIVGGFVVLFGLLIAMSQLLQAIGIEPAQNEVVRTASQEPIAFLLLVPLSILLVGPGEELLYRGVIQGSLNESFHVVRAIVLASAIFASIHVFSLIGSGAGVAAYIGFVFVLATVLGGAYVLSGNLFVPAMIHGLYNAAQFGLAYLQATAAV